MAPDALALSRVNAFYGDSHVLHDVSFTLQEGSLLALLGRNGAGKTTCIHSISGLIARRSGSLPEIFDGRKSACHRGSPATRTMRMNSSWCRTIGMKFGG